MPHDAIIGFPHPVATDGLPGFPASPADVAQARAAVEAERPPVARSCPAWGDVGNRLTLAQARRGPARAEAARPALLLAAVGDRRAARRSRAMAA